MRKVEKYEVADGRTYDDPREALEAELLYCVCNTVPCSLQIGQNIVARWKAISGLIEDYEKIKHNYPVLPKPEDLGPMPHFG